MIQTVHIPVTLDAAAGEDRTISGVAVPWYPTSATVSTGQTVAFQRGAFDLTAKAAKLLEGHDMTQLIGVVTNLSESDQGLMFTAKFANTRRANDAVELVKASAYDSVSVGAIPVKSKMIDGVQVVSEAVLAEISLVAQPAFKDAVITEIAASEPDADETPNPDISEEETMSEATPEVVEAAPIIPTTPIYATAKKHVELPTAVEYIQAAIAGGDAWHQMSEALRAAAPDVKTTDTPGILPQPIVGPVYNNFIGRRPVVDACGVKAMPGGGKVFIRPEVTTHTSMAVQSAESAALQSGTFVVSSNQVTKGVYGGYVVISEQDLEWSDPAVLSLILDDMGRIYANQTDDVAADALASGATVTQNFSAASYTDPSYYQTWIATAAGTILSGSNGNLPNTLFCDVNFWQRLVGLSDSSKRPLFPNVGPMNAFGDLGPAQYGGMAFGLNVVPDRNFASNTLILADTSGFEIFEQQKGALSLDAPSTLTRTLAWRGYFATLMMDETKFVKAAIVA